MLTLYEVIVATGESADGLLSEEVLRETHAQIMTLDEAKALGFSGAQPDEKGREVRLIAVAPRDAQFIQRRLEASHAVQLFRVHEVDA
jgi:hypothetical protein